MRYVEIAIACGLLGLAPSLAHAATAAKKNAERLQLQHIAMVTETCRRRADAIVAAREADAQKKHGIPFYGIVAPSGVNIPVTKEIFADYYMLTCFPVEVLKDPVLNGAPDILAETPGI